MVRAYSGEGQHREGGWGVEVERRRLGADEARADVGPPRVTLRRHSSRPLPFAHGVAALPPRHVARRQPYQDVVPALVLVLARYVEGRFEPAAAANRADG